MKRLALLVAPLLFGCASAKPAAVPEHDPWADFKGDYSHPIAPVTPPGTESAKLAQRLGDGSKENAVTFSSLPARRKARRLAPATVSGKKAKRAKSAS